MFIKKKNYYFYIDSTKSINLNLIKRNQKICIIYRNLSKKEPVEKVAKFKKAFLSFLSTLKSLGKKTILHFCEIF